MCPLFLGASRRVNTAHTSCLLPISALRDSTANSGVPIKTIRIFLVLVCVVDIDVFFYDFGEQMTAEIIDGIFRSLIGICDIEVKIQC